MLVHVGGKRTHERYLLFRQRVEVCISLLANMNWPRFMRVLLMHFVLKKKVNVCLQHSFQEINLVSQKIQLHNLWIQVRLKEDKIHCPK